MTARYTRRIHAQHHATWEYTRARRDRTAWWHVLYFMLFVTLLVAVVLLAGGSFKID